MAVSVYLLLSVVSAGWRAVNWHWLFHVYRTPKDPTGSPAAWVLLREHRGSWLWKGYLWARILMALIYTSICCRETWEFLLRRTQNPCVCSTEGSSLNWWKCSFTVKPTEGLQFCYKPLSEYSVSAAIMEIKWSELPVNKLVGKRYLIGEVCFHALFMWHCKPCFTLRVPLYFKRYMKEQAGEHILEHCVQYSPYLSITKMTLKQMVHLSEMERRWGIYCLFEKCVLEFRLMFQQRK